MQELYPAPDFDVNTAMMPSHTLYFRAIKFPLLIFLLLCACEYDPKDKKQLDQPEFLPDSIDTEGMVDRNLDCPPGKMIICNQGLSFAPLGQSIASIEESGLEEVELADSVDFEMGYVRLNRSFSSAEGIILLEGDPIPEAEATDERISTSNLSRIRIEWSAFHTPDGVHPGMSLEDLSALYSDAEMSIISFASIEQFQGDPDYEYLILNPEKYPNITYLLPDPGHILFKKFGAEEIQLSHLPQQIKISSIVVSV